MSDLGANADRPRLLGAVGMTASSGASAEGGGLGRYFGADPVLLRIAMVILAVAGGGGILIYLVAWVLIPPEREDEELGSARPEGADTTRLIVGGALIAIGTILLLNLSIPALGKYFWPLALIAVGVAVVIRASSRR
ncbi:MAG TPA: PspC domain-containing protein [Actinomycetota bacterium]|nr:PspC domain-containing protein [Actinomycetota bacterium]